MNKLTSIRIKQNDGTYSDDIPVQVLADNVVWTEGSTISLTDILGQVKYTTKGSIQHQLDTFSLSEVENARVGADDTQYQNLKARLDGEYEDLQDAIAAVAANLQTQTGTRSNADTAIRTDLSSETTSRINGDNILSGQITSLSSDVSDLEDALDDEVAARQAAINSEVTARNNAISSAIASEVTNRNSAIAAEATARTNAISAEASARQSADTTLQNNIDVQKARIDNIASLPSGSTSGNAELLDIRIKADGTSASSAGNAVREQITEIKNQLSVSSKGVLTTGTDLNTIKENGLWTLPNRTFPNKPSDFVAGVLMCYHGVVSGDFSQYFVQTLVETGNSANYNKIYTRIFADGVGWGSWAVLAKTDDPATFHRFETFNPDSTAVNLNSFIYGTALVINVNYHPVLNAPNGFTAGILLAFKPHSEYNYIIQILYDTTRGSNTPLFFIRASEGGNWTPWHRILDHTEIQAMIQNASGKMFWKYRLLGIFHTIGVVGDSLASGQGRINDYTHYYDFYDYSWPQCMKRILNNEVYNFTKSGLTTRTWLTDSKGYLLASDGNHKCQCYIIGLGVNDAATLGTQYLGSSSDIDLNDYHNNGDTYYGNYAKIIQMLKEIEPRAVIFTIENPSNNSSLPISSFNQAVSYMETVFDNVYNVRLDSSLYNSTSEFINKNLVSGHYTPAAYQFMAEYLTNTISDIIYNNPEDFYFVNLIGTEYNTPS